MASQTFGQALEAAGTPTGPGSDTPAPNGTWTATLRNCLVREIKAGGVFQLVGKFVVDSGPHARSTAWWSAGFDPSIDMRVQIFRRSCETLGANLADFAGMPVDTPEEQKAVLEAIAPTLVGARAEIRVFEQRGYQEVRLSPLPDGAAPSVLDAPRATPEAKAGIAKVAAASAKPPAPKAPAKAPAGKAPEKPKF